MNRVRAMALEEEGRKGATKLVKMLANPTETLNSVLLLVLVTQLTSATLLGVVLEGRRGDPGCRHRCHPADRRVLRRGRGRAEDVRGAEHRQGRAVGLGVPLGDHPLPADAPLVPRTHRAGERAAPRQGPEGGSVRHRDGDPPDGRRRGRRGSDRRRGAAAHPLDLRVRRHRRPRGDAAPSRHDGDRGRGDDRGRDHGRDRPRLLAAPGLRGHHRQHPRPRLPQGPRPTGPRAASRTDL